MTDMKALIEYIVRSIVSHPDDVIVECDDSSEKLLFTLQVNPEDKGRIIGRKGVVAQSIRSLLRVAAVKEGVHAVLEIE